MDMREWGTSPKTNKDPQSVWLSCVGGMVLSESKAEDEGGSCCQIQEAWLHAAWCMERGSFWRSRPINEPPHIPYEQRCSDREDRGAGCGGYCLTSGEASIANDKWIVEVTGKRWISTHLTPQTFHLFLVHLWGVLWYKLQPFMVVRF